MESVRIFYDNKGNPESVQMSHQEYQKMIQLAKDSLEQKKTMSKISDLISVFL